MSTESERIIGNYSEAKEQDTASHNGVCGQISSQNLSTVSIDADGDQKAVEQDDGINFLFQIFKTGTSVDISSQIATQISDNLGSAATVPVVGYSSDFSLSHGFVSWELEADSPEDLVNNNDASIRMDFVLKDQKTSIAHDTEAFIVNFGYADNVDYETLTNPASNLSASELEDLLDENSDSVLDDYLLSSCQQLTVACAGSACKVALSNEGYLR